MIYLYSWLYIYIYIHSIYTQEIDFLPQVGRTRSFVGFVRKNLNVSATLYILVSHTVNSLGRLFYTTSGKIFLCWGSWSTPTGSLAFGCRVKKLTLLRQHKQILQPLSRKFGRTAPSCGHIISGSQQRPIQSLVPQAM